MTFIPFPTGTVRTVLSFTLNGLSASNTMGWQKAGGSPATSSDGQNLADVVGGWWNSELKSLSSPNITCLGCTAYDMTSSSGWVALSPVNHAGTGSGDVPTNAAALVITLQTASRGRSYRGRIYIPGFPASDLDDPVNWGTSILGNMYTAMNTLISDASGAGFNLGVLSSVQNKVPLTTGIFTPVINHRQNARIGTQRDRLK